MTTASILIVSPQKNSNNINIRVMGYESYDESIVYVKPRKESEDGMNRK